MGFWRNCGYFWGVVMILGGILLFPFGLISMILGGLLIAWLRSHATQEKLLKDLVKEKRKLVKRERESAYNDSAYEEEK
jgi:UPF0716 family protein affecting phage T7 exclusion